MAERFPGHPPTIWVREDALLEAVQRFFADRIFGAGRRTLLAADLETVDERDRQSWADNVLARQRALEDIERRQSRLVSQLESQDDPDGTLLGLVRERLGTLEAERKVKLHELRALQEADPAVREQGLRAVGRPSDRRWGPGGRADRHPSPPV